MLNRNNLLVACAGVAVLFSAACNNPHLSGGKLHFDQERYERAEENFKMAVEAAPEDAMARMFLAMSQAEQGRDEEAANNFIKAGELGPELDDIKKNNEHYFIERYNSGLTYAEEAKEMVDTGDKAGSDEKYREALSELDRALLYDPGHILTLQNQGSIYFRIGDVDSALETFDRLYQVAPENEAVLETLHEVYSGKGNESFQNALDAKAGDDDAEARKQLEAAVAFYDKADQMGAENIEVTQNRAAVVWELADIVPEKKEEYLQKAKAGYAKVHEAEPENESIILNLSLLTNALGETDEALKYAKALVDIDPKNAKYHVNEGRIHGSLDNKTDMFGGLLLGQALQQGVKQAPSIARDMAEAHGPRSDMLERYRLDADPDEIRVFADTGGSEYQIWFYWARGTAYAFQEGSLIFSKSFEKVIAGGAESE